MMAKRFATISAVASFWREKVEDGKCFLNIVLKSRFPDACVRKNARLPNELFQAGYPKAFHSLSKLCKLPASH